MINNRICCILLLVIVSLQTVAQSFNHIIPQPVEVQKLSASNVRLTGNATVYFSPAFKQQAFYFSELFASQTGITLAVKPFELPEQQSLQNAIVLEHDSISVNRPEMYRLAIRDAIVQMKARDVRGIVNAIQTLLQLLPLQKQSIVQFPAVMITDYPRFAYRGMHLDVVRHFFPVAYIKKYIDYLAFHKLNTFHWHLTDDQGWRLPSERYPLLNSVGSWRDSTLIGHFKDTPVKYDGQRYGGFYTGPEITEVLTYAAVRGINVIPEIDVPGHARAIIAAYPQFSTKPDTAWRVATTWGMYNRQNNVLAPNDSTFAFLNDIFDELCDLFPSTYIHIGGDECSRLWWKQDPRTQAFIKEKGLSNEAALQTFFSNFVASRLKTLGRKTIGWHEIADGDLDTSAIIMNWANDAKAVEVARKGFSMVMTPGKPFYFDHYQSKDPKDSLAIHGYNPLEAVYNYRIVPEKLKMAGLEHKIIGGQANVWTEYIGSEAKVDYMVLPRMAALSENLWSIEERKSYKDFLRRLEANILPRYRLWGSTYFSLYRKWDVKKGG
jgi:hexosaminidase